MSVPCVRVPQEDGEATRQALAERDLIDDGHEIVVEEGSLYVPVTDPTAVPGEYTVLTRELPARETQTMPAELVDFPVSYERIGDVVVIDEDDPERARALADAIVESALPVATVLNRASKIKGDLRVRDWEVLAREERGDEDAGRSPTETVHREYGCEFAVDLAEVYFSPRLATERHRVTEQVEAGELALDMFAGVGPFVVPFAKQGADVVGVDLNADAITYLRENTRRNGVEDRVTALHGDVQDLAAETQRDDETATAGEYVDWADRLVMNLPHSADAFLDTAVALAGEECMLHYYDIQHESDPYDPGEAAIREAAEPEYDVRVETRRTVRSYAPHELNVVLDVRLER